MRIGWNGGFRSIFSAMFGGVRRRRAALTPSPAPALREALTPGPAPALRERGDLVRELGIVKDAGAPLLRSTPPFSPRMKAEGS